MGKSNLNYVWVGALVIVAYLVFFGGLGGGEVKPNNDSPQDSGGCSIEDISFNAKMTRLGKAGTSLSGTNVQNYYILTDNLGSQAASAATTVPTNYKMQVIFGENSSTYYSVVKTVDTGCSDPFFESVQLPLADTSLNSFWVENSDGSVNSNGNNESMGADDRFEATVTIKAGTDSYFGNPFSDCKNVGVLEYNKTSFRVGEGDNPTAVPGSFTYTGNRDGSVGFYIPKTADGVEAKFNVAIETVSTLPSKFTSDQPILHLYDCDIDKNEDTLELIEEIEDEDLNSIALGHQTKTIYIDA